MIRRFFTWLLTTVLGWPSKSEEQRNYFVAVREGRDKSRVEQLPDGSKVFYVDVTDVPSNRVEAYLKRAKQSLTNESNLVGDSPD